MAERSGTGDAVGRMVRLLGAASGRLTALSSAELGSWLATLSEGTLVTKVLGAEPLCCRDLRALGRTVRTEGRPLFVDDTLPGPWGCPAARLGAHVVLVALDEGCTLVALARGAERMLPGVTEALAGLPAPGEAAASTEARVHELEARWHASSDSAAVVASYLRCHPAVGEVRYPGLKGDPSFEVAARTLQGGFGPLIDYRLRGGVAWQRVRCDASDPREQVRALESRLMAGQGLTPPPSSSD